AGVRAHGLTRLLQLLVMLVDVGLQPLEIAAQGCDLLADIGSGAGARRHTLCRIVSGADGLRRGAPCLYWRLGDRRLRALLLGRRRNLHLLGLARRILILLRGVVARKHAVDVGAATEQ